MGLVISYYKNLVPANPSTCDYESGEAFCEESSHTALTSYHWPERAAGLPENPTSRSSKEHGCFIAQMAGSFHAGSYSYYGEWRDWLCKMSHGISGKEFWARMKGAGYGVNDAFAELIHFSDCEGVIGPEVSAKLYKDFRRNYQKARAFALKENCMAYITTYKGFMQAFETASNNGAVYFG